MRWLWEYTLLSDCNRGLPKSRPQVSEYSRKLYTKTKYKGFSKTCPNPAIQIPPKYRETRQIRYIGDYPVLPIGYCKTKNAVQHKVEAHPYAEENRHELVALQISKMWNSKMAWADNIAFAVNCISRYAAQKGKCAITKRFLMMDEAEGHHINPRHKGGTDEYANIAILSPEAHLLVKVTNPILIKPMLAEFEAEQKANGKTQRISYSVRNTSNRINQS